MEFILIFIIFYTGIKLITESIAELVIKRHLIEKYKCFKFYYPKDLGRKKFEEYLKKLINTDFPELPDNKKLEYVIARMRTMNFPEGIRVEYRGDVLEV